MSAVHHSRRYVPAEATAGAVVATSSRGGFTAVEILVVLGIMMVIMGAAAPTVLTAIRRSQVNSAAESIVECWRLAQHLAMSTAVPPAETAMPKHYGIMIVQAAPGGRSSVAVIFDNRDAATIAGDQDAAVLRADPTNASTSDSANPPVCKHPLGRSVLLSSALGGAAPDTAARTLVLYAQYRTGIPIEPAAVVAGQGSIASPSGIGIAGSALFSLPGSSISALRLQTVDYSDTATPRRGYALGLTLTPIGYLSCVEP